MPSTSKSSYYEHKIAMSSNAPKDYPNWIPDEAERRNSDWAKINVGDRVTAEKIKDTLMVNPADFLFVFARRAGETPETASHLIITIVTRKTNDFASAWGSGFRDVPDSTKPCPAQVNVDQAFTTFVAPADDMGVAGVVDDDRYARVLFFGSLRLPNPPATTGTELGNSAATGAPGLRERPGAFLDALTTEPCLNSRVILNNPNNWVIDNAGGPNITVDDLPAGNRTLPSQGELVALLNAYKHKIGGDLITGTIDFRKVVATPNTFGTKTSAAGSEGKEIIILDEAPLTASGATAQGVLVYPPRETVWCPGDVIYHYTGGTGQNIILSNEGDADGPDWKPGNFRTTFHSTSRSAVAGPLTDEGVSEAYYALPSELEHLGAQTLLQKDAIADIKAWLGRNTGGDVNYRILITGNSDYSNISGEPNDNNVTVNRSIVVSNELQDDPAIRFGALDGLNLAASSRNGLPNVTSDMNRRQVLNSRTTYSGGVMAPRDNRDIRVYNYSNTEFTRRDVYSDLIQFSIPGGLNTNSELTNQAYTEDGVQAPHSWAWINPGSQYGRPDSIIMAVRNTSPPALNNGLLPVGSTPEDSAARRECWWSTAGEKRRLFEQQILSVSSTSVAWPTSAAADAWKPDIGNFVKVEKIYDLAAAARSAAMQINAILDLIACPAAAPNDFKTAISALGATGQIIIIEISRYASNVKAPATPADLNPLTANYTAQSNCAGGNCGFYGVWKNVRVPNRIIGTPEEQDNTAPVANEDWPLGLAVGGGTMLETDDRWTHRPYITIDSITTMLHDDGQHGDLPATDSKYQGPNQGFRYHQLAQTVETVGAPKGYKVIRTPADPSEFIEFHIGISDENVNAFNNHHHENIMIPIGIWKEDINRVSTFTGGIGSLELPGKTAAKNSFTYNNVDKKRVKRDEKSAENLDSYVRDRTVNPYEIAIKFDQIFAENITVNAASADIFESHSLAWRMDPTEWGANNTTRPTPLNAADLSNATSFEPLPAIFSASEAAKLDSIYKRPSYNDANSRYTRYTPLYNISSAGVLTAGIRLDVDDSENRQAYQSMTGSDIDSMARGEELIDGNFEAGNNDINDVDWPFQKILGAPLPIFNETEAQYGTRVSGSHGYTNIPGYPNGTYKLLLNSTLLSSSHPLYLTDGSIERYPMRVSNPWTYDGAAYTHNPVFPGTGFPAEGNAWGLYDIVAGEHVKTTALPNKYWTRTITSGGHDAGIRSNNRFIHVPGTLTSLGTQLLSNNHYTALDIYHTNNAELNRNNRWVSKTSAIGAKPFAFELYRDNESIQARTALSGSVLVLDTLGIASGSATNWFDTISLMSGMSADGFYTQTNDPVMRKMLGQADYENSLLGQETLENDKTDGIWEDYDVQMFIEPHILGGDEYEPILPTDYYLEHTQGDVILYDRPGYISGRACFRIDSNLQPEEDVAGDVINAVNPRLLIPAGHVDYEVSGEVSYVPGDRDDFNIFGTPADPASTRYLEKYFGFADDDGDSRAYNDGSVQYIDIRYCRFPIGVNDDYATTGTGAQDDNGFDAGLVLNSAAALRGPWGDVDTSSDMAKPDNKIHFSDWHKFIGGSHYGVGAETNMKHHDNGCCLTDKSTRVGTYTLDADHPHGMIPTNATRAVVGSGDAVEVIADFPYVGTNWNPSTWTAKQRRMKGYNGKGQRWNVGTSWATPKEDSNLAGRTIPGGRVLATVATTPNFWNRSSYGIPEMTPLPVESGKIMSHAWKPEGIFQKGQNIEGFHVQHMPNFSIFKMTAPDTVITNIQLLDQHGLKLDAYVGADELPVLDEHGYIGDQAVFGRGPAATSAQAGQGAYFKLANGTPIYGLRLWLSNKTIAHSHLMDCETPLQMGGHDSKVVTEKGIVRDTTGHRRWPGIVQTFWPKGRGEAASTEATKTKNESKWWPAARRSNSKKWGIPSDLMGGSSNANSGWSIDSRYAPDYKGVLDPMNIDADNLWKNYDPTNLAAKPSGWVYPEKYIWKAPMLLPNNGGRSQDDFNFEIDNTAGPASGLRFYEDLPALKQDNGKGKFNFTIETAFTEPRCMLNPAVKFFDAFREKSTHYPWLSDSIEVSDIPMFKLTHKGSSCFRRPRFVAPSTPLSLYSVNILPTNSDGQTFVFDGVSQGEAAAKAIHLHKPYKDSVFFVTNRVENASAAPEKLRLFKDVNVFYGEVNTINDDTNTAAAVTYLSTGTAHPRTRSHMAPEPDSRITQDTIIDGIIDRQSFQGLGYLGGGYGTHRAVNEADYISGNQPLPAPLYDGDTALTAENLMRSLPVRTRQDFVGPFAQGGSISRSSAAMGAYGMLFPPRLSNSPSVDDSALMHQAASFISSNGKVNGLLALGYNVDTAASSIVPFYERVCKVGHRVRTSAAGTVINSSMSNPAFSAKKYESGYYATFPALSDWPFRNSLRFKGHFEEYQFIEKPKSTELIKFTAHNCAFSRSLLSSGGKGGADLSAVNGRGDRVNKFEFKYQVRTFDAAAARPVWVDAGAVQVAPATRPRTIAIGAPSNNRAVSTTQFSSLGQYARVSTLFQLDYCGGLGGGYRGSFGLERNAHVTCLDPREEESDVYKWSLAMNPNFARTWWDTAKNQTNNVILSTSSPQSAAAAGDNYDDYFDMIHGSYVSMSKFLAADTVYDMPDSGVRYLDTHGALSAGLIHNTLQPTDFFATRLHGLRPHAGPGDARGHSDDYQVRCINNIKFPSASPIGKIYPYYDKTTLGSVPFAYDPAKWEVENIPAVKIKQVDTLNWFWPNSALPEGHPNLARAIAEPNITRLWPTSNDTTSRNYREVNNVDRIIVPADSVFHKFNSESDIMIGPAWVELEVQNGNFVEEFPWEGNLTLGTHTAGAQWRISRCPGALAQCPDGFHQNVPDGQCFKDCIQPVGGTIKIVDRGDAGTSKCECENQSTACPAGESRDPETCECTACPACISPKTERVPGSCDCKCPAGGAQCPPGQELDPETCECTDSPCEITEDDCTCDQDFVDVDCACVDKNPPIHCSDRKFKDPTSCECVECETCEEADGKQDVDPPADLEHCCECIPYYDDDNDEILKVPYWTSPASTLQNPIFPRTEAQGGPYTDLNQAYSDFQCLCNQGTAAYPSGLIWSEAEEYCVCENPSDVYNETLKRCEPCDPTVVCPECLANENLADCCPCPAGHGRYMLGQPDTTNANLCLCRPCANIAVYIDNQCSVKIGDYLCPKCFGGTPFDDGSGSPCIKIQNFCCPNPDVLCDWAGGPNNWPKPVCIKVCGMPLNGEWWVTNGRPTYASKDFIDVTLKVDGELDPKFNIFSGEVNTNESKLRFNDEGSIIPPTLTLKTRAGAAFNYTPNSWAAGVFGASILVPQNNSLKFYDPTTFNVEYIYPNITDILNPDGSIKTAGFALYPVDYTPDMKVQFKVDNSIVHIDDLHTYVEGCHGEEVDYADGSGYTFNFTTINPHYSADEAFAATSCLNQEWRERYERWITENIPAANSIFGSVANVAFTSANNTATGRNATHSYSKLLEFGSNDISTSISISAHDAIRAMYPPTANSSLLDDKVAKLSYAEYEYNLNQIKSSIKIIKPEHINEFAQLYRTTIND